jgi:hypothetical protein
MSTCCFCNVKIDHIPDGVLRWCKCNRLGVDCKKEYTRYLGSKPVQHMTKEEIEYVNKLKMRIEPGYFKLI